MKITRRWSMDIFGIALGVAAAILTAGRLDAEQQSQAAPAFGYETVITLAAEAARKPFREPAKVPQMLLQMDYDQWRSIRFKPQKALWRGAGQLFEVQFFHPGFFYDHAVGINVVENGRIRRVPFSTSLFDYGENTFENSLPPDVGYAGFRLHFPLNTSDYADEVIVFLGASYFRAIGRHQTYGLSSRGLAIDTALQKGEEFPFFREFWLVKPHPGDRRMTIFALLDSQSISGAYQFMIEPGASTMVEVDCTLFLRREVAKIGFAPLTSMFFYGENVNIRPVDDFRPEVHDSDGLLINLGSGEWLWRPLRNPQILALSMYKVDQLKGFGLLQRDLDFDHYQDIEADYHRRPSVWITPRGHWGAGRVELIEIPTREEINDNIVAFWVPDKNPDQKMPYSFSYHMSWFLPRDAPHQGGRTLATRVMDVDSIYRKRFVIDFEGQALEPINDALELDAVISATKGGHVVEQQLQKNPFDQSWRLAFLLALDEKHAIDKLLDKPEKIVELRAFLRHKDDVVSETWSYRIDY